MRSLITALSLSAGFVAAMGCSTGEGEGWVRSEQLLVKNCWNGTFDLKPTFFAADPFLDESISMRIQRGDNNETVSDGLLVVVNDAKGIRGEGEGPSLLGQPLAVGLPASLEVLGQEPTSTAATSRVNLSLYLNDTCSNQNATVHAVSGSITFKSLFSGNPNEPSADNRLTEADFTAEFADPRDLQGSEDAQTSTMQGHFRFFFQRGQPAQPFP